MAARLGVAETRAPVILATMSRKCLAELAYSSLVAGHSAPRPGLAFDFSGPPERTSSRRAEGPHRPVNRHSEFITC